MLDTVAELAEDTVGNIGRVLAHKIDAHAARADEPRHLFDLLEQGRRDAVKEQVRLVEEKDQARLVPVARFGEVLEKFGKQPEQDAGIQARRVHQGFRRQDADDAAPVGIGLEQVHDVQRRLAEERVAALLLQAQQRPLDGAHAGRGDLAVAGLVGVALLAHMPDHAPQVLHVEQEQPGIVGDAEGQLQDARLHLVEVEQPPEQERSHFAHRGTQGVPVLAEHVPEADGEGPGRVAERLQVEQGRPFRRLARAAGPGETGKVALDVGHEDRHAQGAEGLGETLQGHGLAGARGAGDESVAVAHGRQDAEFPVSGHGNERVMILVQHAGPPRPPGAAAVSHPQRASSTQAGPWASRWLAT